MTPEDLAKSEEFDVPEDKLPDLRSAIYDWVTGEISSGRFRERTGITPWDDFEKFKRLACSLLWDALDMDKHVTHASLVTKRPSVEPNAPEEGVNAEVLIDFFAKLQDLKPQESCGKLIPEGIPKSDWNICGREFGHAGECWTISKVE